MAKQTFTTGQVLTAAQVNSLQSNDFNQTVSTKTAAYTLVAADKGTRIEFNTSGSVACTVNTGLFDAGDTLVIQNRGAGVVTVTAGTATVNTSATLALSQYDAGTLYFISASAAIFFNTDAGGGSPLTTKGDLYGFSTVDARIPIGANDTVLTADSTQSLGLKWATPTSGGWTSIASGNLSSTSVALTSIPGTYYELALFIDNPFVNSADRMRLRCNADSSSVYSTTWTYVDTSAWSNASGKTGVDFWNASNNGSNLPTSAGNLSAVVRIPNYAATSIYKSIYLQGWTNSANWGGGAGGFGISHYEGGTGAITSLTITTENGTATFSGGTYALYGLK